jgi:hypothetical protein
MSDRRTQLARRRRELLDKSDMQRRSLAANVEHIEAKLRGVDHMIGLAKRFVAQPLLLAGGLATVMMIGPKRLLAWAGRGLVLFSTGRRLLNRD